VPLRPARHRRLQEHATLVLFLALLASLYLVGTPARLYQGGTLFVDVATATLLYQLHTHRVPRLTAPLSTRTLTAVGQRSYALYLVHWPLATLLAPGNSSVEMGMVRVGLSFAMAEGLHRLVENRFRTSSARPGPRRALSPRFSVGLLVVAMVAVVVLLPSTKRHTRLPGASLVSALATTATTTTTMTATATAAPQPAPAPAPPLRVDVFGDSTALVFGYFGSVAGSEVGAIRISGEARRGCGTIDNDAASRIGYLPRPSDCAGWRERWSTMAGRDRPDISIVMTGAWEMLDQITPHRRLTAGSPPWTAVVTAALTDALREVAPTTGRVIVMPLPCFGAGDRNAVPERADPRRIATFNAILADVAAREGAVVSPWRDLVCPNGIRLTKTGGSPVWLDDGIHLSPAGAVTVWKWLLPQLRQLDTTTSETAGTWDDPRPAKGESSTIRLVGVHTID
jgi:hypothetical protein